MAATVLFLSGGGTLSAGFLQQVSQQPHSQYLKRAIFISLPNAETEPSSIAKGVSCLLTPLLIFLFLPAENSRLENLRQEARQHSGKVKDRYSSAPRAQGMNRLISSSQKPHS